jgi:chemotaxis protein methyltransferase CheR
MLVSSRVNKRLRALELSDYSAYLAYLLADRSGKELVFLLDVISTNVTSFFRESVHFDVLRDFFKDRYISGQRRFRFWCAAASSGEEPYTMAIVLRRLMEKHPCDVKILATDISTHVLAKAVQGIYDPQKVAMIPENFRARYFSSVEYAGMQCVQVRDELKTLISFKRLNLSVTPFPMKGSFDIIFCRNVMIYFDNEVRARLVSECERLLAPDGLLITGHAESLSNIKSGLHSLRPSIYKKQGRLTQA